MLSRDVTDGLLRSGFGHVVAEQTVHRTTKEVEVGRVIVSEYLTLDGVAERPG